MTDIGARPGAGCLGTPICLPGPGFRDILEDSGQIRPENKGVLTDLAEKDETGHFY